MKFGPFPQHFIARLKEKLTEHGGTCEVTVDGDKRDEYRRKEKGFFKRYPTFEHKDLFLIDIPLEFTLIVKGELEAMGVVFSESDFDPQLDALEYVCPRCERVGQSGQSCPKHDQPYLEFSEVVGWRERRSTRIQGHVIRIGASLAMGLLAYWYFG